MKINELNLVEEHLNSNNSPFRFNAKELDCLSRLALRFGKETGNYYYGARYGVYPEHSRRDPKWSILALSIVEGWISVDPLAELMPEWSSYAYTFNNPVNFTDPTGMVGEEVNGPDDIIIWYKDENGKDASFRFTGYNFHDSPDNDFVDAVLGAIFYNISNGGGDNLKKAANDKVNDHHIIQGEGGRSSSYRDGGRDIIYWDENAGLELENKDVLSPATVLEHETDHSVSRSKNAIEHYDRRSIKDPKYKNMEEKRVIQGSETKTARANGEISETKRYSREIYTKDSNGKRIIHSVKVKNEISTEITEKY